MQDNNRHLFRDKVVVAIYGCLLSSMLFQELVSQKNYVVVSQMTVLPKPIYANMSWMDKKRWFVSFSTINLRYREALAIMDIPQGSLHCIVKIIASAGHDHAGWRQVFWRLAVHMPLFALPPIILHHPPRACYGLSVSVRSQKCNPATDVVRIGVFLFVSKSKTLTPCSRLSSPFPNLPSNHYWSS